MQAQVLGKQKMYNRNSLCFVYEQRCNVQQSERKKEKNRCYFCLLTEMQCTAKEKKKRKKTDAIYNSYTRYI